VGLGVGEMIGRALRGDSRGVGGVVLVGSLRSCH
jgi:hypothetical protein